MPPYSITGEVRTRVAPHIFVDLQRTYYFNFGTLRWSPELHSAGDAVSGRMSRASRLQPWRWLSCWSAPPARFTLRAELLSYQDGFVFFTTGDGFRVSPNVIVHDAASGAPSQLKPRPRLWARAVFDADGNVTELDLSRTLLPPEDDYASGPQVCRRRPARSRIPIWEHQPETRNHSRLRDGRPVLVQFTVEVPPGTPPNANIYIMTDASGWNPQAIPMDRVDALHFRVTRRLNSGTVFFSLPLLRAVRLADRRKTRRKRAATAPAPAQRSPTPSALGERHGLLLWDGHNRGATQITAAVHDHADAPTIRRRSRTCRPAFPRRTAVGPRQAAAAAGVPQAD